MSWRRKPPKEKPLSFSDDDLAVFIKLMVGSFQFSQNSEDLQSHIFGWLKANVDGVAETASKISSTEAGIRRYEEKIMPTVEAITRGPRHGKLRVAGSVAVTPRIELERFQAAEPFRGDSELLMQKLVADMIAIDYSYLSGRKRGNQEGKGGADEPHGHIVFYSALCQHALQEPRKSTRSLEYDRMYEQAANFLRDPFLFESLDNTHIQKLIAVTYAHNAHFPDAHIDYPWHHKAIDKSRLKEVLQDLISADDTHTLSNTALPGGMRRYLETITADWNAHSDESIILPPLRSDIRIETDGNLLTRPLRDAVPAGVLGVSIAAATQLDIEQAGRTLLSARLDTPPSKLNDLQLAEVIDLSDGRLIIKGGTVTIYDAQSVAIADVREHIEGNQIVVDGRTMATGDGAVAIITGASNIEIRRAGETLLEFTSDNASLAMGKDGIIRGGSVTIHAQTRTTLDLSPLPLIQALKTQHTQR